MNTLFAERSIIRLKVSITLLIVGIVTMTAGCEKEQTDYSIEDLLGTWEFVAFGAPGGSLDTVHRYYYYPEDCYTITFYEDTTMTGRSVINLLAKKFLLSGNQISFPWGVAADASGETGEPEKFTEALRDVTSFKIEDSQLILFYNYRKYLLFDFKTNQL